MSSSPALPTASSPSSSLTPAWIVDGEGALVEVRIQRVTDVEDPRLAAAEQSAAAHGAKHVLLRTMADLYYITPLMPDGTLTAVGWPPPVGRLGADVWLDRASALPVARQRAMDATMAANDEIDGLLQQLAEARVCHERARRNLLAASLLSGPANATGGHHYGRSALATEVAQEQQETPEARNEP